MHKDSLTDGIRQRMEGYHEQPDNDVWRHLVQRLDRLEVEKRKGIDLFLRPLPYVLFFLVAISPSPSVNNPPSGNPVANASRELTVTPNASVEANIDRDCDNKSVKLLTLNDVLPKDDDRTMKMTHRQKLFQPDTAVVTTDENQQERSKEVVESTEETSKVKPDTSAAKTEKHDKRSGAPRLISFYSSFTPSLNYFTIKPSGSDEMIVSKLAHIPIASWRRASYQVDLGFQWLVNDRITAYGGLAYHLQNIHLNYQYYEERHYTVTSGTNTGDYNISPVYQTAGITYAMRNIGVQAGALYRLQGEKLSHHAGIGLSYQHGIMTSSADDGYNNYQSHYAFVQILYRMEFKVNPTTSVFAQPNFMQAIFSKEGLTAPFRITPYRVGLGFGVVYTIKR